MAETLFAGTYTINTWSSYTDFYNENYIYYIASPNNELYNTFRSTGSDDNPYFTFAMPCTVRYAQYENWGDSTPVLTNSFDGLAIIASSITGQRWVESESGDGYYEEYSIPTMSLYGYNYQNIGDSTDPNWTNVYTSLTSNQTIPNYYDTPSTPVITLNKTVSLNESLATEFVTLLFKIATPSNGGGSPLFPIEVNLSNINGLTLATENTIINNNIIIKMNPEDLAKLIPSNITKGVTIMGVVGTWAGWGETVTVTIAFQHYDYNEFGPAAVPYSCSGSYTTHAATSTTTSFTSKSSLTITIPKAGSIEIYVSNYDDNESMPGEGFAFVDYDNPTCLITTATSAKTWILSEFTANTSLTFTINSY